MITLINFLFIALSLKMVISIYKCRHQIFRSFQEYVILIILWRSKKINKIYSDYDLALSHKSSLEAQLCELEKAYND
jgi:hypothetical protein